MKIFLIILVTLLSIIFCLQVAARDLPKPLVDTAWLGENIEQVFILDVRNNKNSFTSKPIYREDKETKKSTLVKVGGHIPGAKFVLYKNFRGDQKVNNNIIKHMLPSKDKFEKLIQQTGINRDSLIVIVTNAENDYDITMAARVYWQFKYFGHDEISILNGGTAQWLIDGHVIATTPASHSVGNWIAKEQRNKLLASSDEVAAAIDNDTMQLIDVRPLGQYLGTYKSSKVSEKGHIPSAKNYPVELVASKKSPVKFSSKTELLQVSNALGVNANSPSITYCNSGHMAAGGWFVMHALLGNENVKLYDGSMHQWTLEKRPTVKMIIE